MNNQARCVFAFFILKKFSGIYFPIDIIHLIVSAYERILPKDFLCCSSKHTILKIDNKIYSTMGNEFTKLLQNIIENDPNILQFYIEYNSVYYLDSNHDFRYVTNDHIASEVKYASIDWNSNCYVIKTNGDLYLWGTNKYHESGLWYTLDLNESQKTLLYNVKQIICKDCGLVAITANNDLYAWGLDMYMGRTRSYNHIPRKIGSDYVYASAGSNFIMAVNSSGQLFTLGFGPNGQLGLGDITTSSSLIQVLISDPVVSVSCGDSHTMALTKNKELFSWGKNYMGQLGTGDYLDKYSPQKILTRVEMVSCGWEYTIAMRTDRSIYAWGYNLYGQLLLDSDSHRIPTPTKVKL